MRIQQHKNNLIELMCDKFNINFKDNHNSLLITITRKVDKKQAVEMFETSDVNLEMCYKCAYKTLIQVIHREGTLEQFFNRMFKQM